MTQRGSVSRSLEFGLCFLGLWPGLSYAAINWSLCVLLLLATQYFLYSFAVLHFDLNHIGPLIDCLSLALAYTLLTLKLVNLGLKRRLFREIIEAIADDWKEASVVASSIPVMLQKAELARTCFNTLMIFNALAASLYVIGGYTIHLMQSNNDTHVFPVRMELPFDYSTSPVFELTMIAQCLHQVATSVCVTTLNGFLFTLIIHLSGQIDIMCENVRQITLKRREFLSTMRRLIYRHQKIINFTNNINDLFSFISLLEFAWNTIVICCVGLAIVASIGTEDVLTMMTKSVTFYIAVTLETFIFCYSGEYLIAKVSMIYDFKYVYNNTFLYYYYFLEELYFAWFDSADALLDFHCTVLIFTFLIENLRSKSIGDAVYESLWYNLKPRECQVLLFVLMRSQKQLTITAGGLMDLSLEVFSSIMKASGSYVSVLHAMY